MCYIGAVKVASYDLAGPIYVLVLCFCLPY